MIAEVVIPDDKRLTYDLTKALLDNYRLDQTKREDTTQPEAAEMLALIEAVTDSAPMEATRWTFWASAAATPIRGTSSRTSCSTSGFANMTWAAISTFPASSMWWSASRRRARSVGYHFWYRYYLDDFGLLGTGDDIDFQGTKYPKAPDRGRPLDP